MALCALIASARLRAGFKLVEYVYAESSNTDEFVTEIEFDLVDAAVKNKDALRGTLADAMKLNRKTDPRNR